MTICLQIIIFYFMATSQLIRIRLAELLDEFEISQTELAEMTGLPRTNINRMVNHPGQIKKIGLATIEAICKALNIQTHRLIEYVPD